MFYYFFYLKCLTLKSDIKLVLTANTPVGRIKTIKDSYKLENEDKSSKEKTGLKICPISRKTNVLIIVDRSGLKKVHVKKTTNFSSTLSAVA